MTFPDFKDKVLSEITDRYADSAEVSLTNVVKNNGREQCGVVIHEPSFELSPTIYLEDYYARLCSGSTFDEILDTILNTYERYKLPMGSIAEHFSDYSWVKKNVVMRLINRGRNKELLTRIPFVPFLDLAVCFAVRIEVKRGVYGSALIHNSHIEAWDTDAIELFAAAKQCSFTTMPPVCKRLEDMLFELLKKDIRHPDSEPSPIYILTNTERSYGASVLCYHDVVKSLADLYDSDLLIIPSSVHEVMAIPAVDCIEPEALNAIIASVNESEVPADEQLSDHLYRYNRATDTISY